MTRFWRWRNDASKCILGRSYTLWLPLPLPLLPRSCFKLRYEGPMEAALNTEHFVVMSGRDRDALEPCNAFYIQCESRSLHRFITAGKPLSPCAWVKYTSERFCPNGHPLQRIRQAITNSLACFLTHDARFWHLRAVQEACWIIRDTVVEIKG